MPTEGVALRQHCYTISFEEIVTIVKIAATEFGFEKIRLTGGEPLMRRDIVKLVTMLAKISEIKDLAMTTNGILLPRFAKNLANAGLQRVNISLDTLDEKKFAAITRGGNVNMALEGIDAALQAGLTPVKINCVIDPSTEAGNDDNALMTTENDINAIKKYARTRGVEVRLIQRMNFTTGTFNQVIGGQAGECKTCNRLRLLSDGKILSCLFSDATFDTRTLGAREALIQAIKTKPQKGSACTMKWMASVGG